MSTPENRTFYMGTHMDDTGTVVTNYMQAIGERDFDKAREYLADRGFRYTSPIGSYDDADRFIHSLFGVGPILQKVEIRKLFVSGNEAMAMVDTLVTLRGYQTHHTAMWFRVDGPRIRAMEAFFDASSYKEMFADQFAVENQSP